LCNKSGRKNILTKELYQENRQGNYTNKSGKQNKPNKGDYATKPVVRIEVARKTKM
jgi:hypothetical protein